MLNYWYVDSLLKKIVFFFFYFYLFFSVLYFVYYREFEGMQRYGNTESMQKNSNSAANQNVQSLDQFIL